jgi:hypothetical protein
VRSFEEKTLKTTLQPAWMATGIVEAPVEQVWKTYIVTNEQLTPEEKATVAQAQSPVRFPLYKEGEYGAQTAHKEVDGQRHTFALQGGWWYRGVITVEPHEQGSLLRYQVYNLAKPWQQWMIPVLLERNMPEKTRTTHEQLLRHLGKQLVCQAYLVEK